MHPLVGLKRSMVRKRHRQETPQAVCTDMCFLPPFLFSELGFWRSVGPHCGQLQFLLLCVVTKDYVVEEDAVAFA